MQHKKHQSMRSQAKSGDFGDNLALGLAQAEAKRTKNVDLTPISQGTSPATSPRNSSGKGEEDSSNLWQRLLKDASRKSAVQHHITPTLFVLGDRKSGKTTLLSQWKYRENGSGRTLGGANIVSAASAAVDAHSAPCLLDYSYLNVKNRHALDKEEVQCRMGVWVLEDDKHGSMLPDLSSAFPPTPALAVQISGPSGTNPAQPAPGTNISNKPPAVFIITLDLSKPWQVEESLWRWLAVYRATADAIMERFSPEQQAAFKLKLSASVQEFQAGGSGSKASGVSASVSGEAAQPAAEGGDEASSSSSSSGVADGSVLPSQPVESVLDPRVPPQNMGVPLIVVGCKADRLAGLLKTAAQDKFDFLTNRIRRIILDYGGSLVFASAAPTATGDAPTSALVVEDAVYSRAFDFPLPHNPKVVGSCEDFGIFVPCGYDSLDLLAAATTGKRNGWNEATQFAEVFGDITPHTEKAKIGVGALAEQDFFQLLAKQLESGKPIPLPNANPTLSITSSGNSGGGSHPPSPSSANSQGGRGRSSSASKKKDDQAVRNFFNKLQSNAKPDDKLREQAAAYARS